MLKVLYDFQLANLGGQPNHRVSGLNESSE